MKKKLSIISRISFVCFTAYFSVVMCLGLVGGYFLGRFISRRVLKGRYRCLIFQVKGVKVHLHHWIFGVAWLLVLKFYTQSFLGIENLFLSSLGLGSGVIIEDIWHDRKWWRVFRKLE